MLLAKRRGTIRVLSWAHKPWQKPSPSMIHYIKESGLSNDGRKQMSDRRNNLITVSSGFPADNQNLSGGTHAMRTEEDGASQGW